MTAATAAAARAGYMRAASRAFAEAFAAAINEMHAARRQPAIPADYHLPHQSPPTERRPPP